MVVGRLEASGRRRAGSWRSPDHLHYRSLWRELERRASLAQGTIVDVGCGNKPYEELFGSRSERYIGVDVTFDGTRADALLSDKGIELDDGVADFVLCTQVLEHSPRPAWLLAEIARVLRPGGALLLTVPMYWPHHEEPHDYFRFTRHGVRLLVEEGGFSVEDMAPCGGPWSVAGLAVIHASDSRVVRILANAVFGFLDRGGRADWRTSTILCVARRPAS